MLVLCALVLHAATSTQAEDADESPKPKPAENVATAHKLLRRVSVAVDKFGEGWKQTIPLEASPGDAYDVWVKDGWLHAKRYNAQGDLDWQIMLARIAGPQPPEISLIEGALVFELSYADGRYFIRESNHVLRCVRQRKSGQEYLSSSALLSEQDETGFWGRTSMPELMLSDWRDKEWCYIASGADKERVDAVVRLNPLKKQSPGYGVQTIVGGYAYYFHGRAWLMDDGELLVASRTLESSYKAELARDKIRQNLSGGAPPKIDATSWLNTNDDLSWDKLNGKVVVLDFWGTWCGPCVKKLPDVKKLAEKYAERDLVVIGIHSAQGGDTCREFVEQNKISYPIAIDSGKTAEAFAVSSWPSVFVIDKTGKVIAGYTSDLPSDQMIENLLSN